MVCSCFTSFSCIIPVPNARRAGYILGHQCQADRESVWVRIKLSGPTTPAPSFCFRTFMSFRAQTHRLPFALTASSSTYLLMPSHSAFPVLARYRICPASLTSLFLINSPFACIIGSLLASASGIRYTARAISRYSPSTLERKRKCSSERGAPFLLLRVTGGRGASSAEIAGGVVFVEEREEIAPVRKLAALGFETGVARRQMRVGRMRSMEISVEAEDGDRNSEKRASVSMTRK